MGQKIMNALYIIFLLKLLFFAWCVYKFGWNEMAGYYDNLIFHPFALAIYVHIAIRCVDSFLPLKASSTEKR